jgi:hypothetical protein
VNKILSRSGENNKKMKKIDIIKKTIERISNLPKDVAVVVYYKGKKHSLIPEYYNEPSEFKNLTMDEIKPFLFGEIVEEQQEICESNPKYQFFTFRAEAGIDAWSLAHKCSEHYEQIQFHSFQLTDEPLLGGNYGKIFAPAQMTLIEVKLLMWEIAEKYKISDVHVLIQSLDYPIFEGLRDRDSPNPLRSSLSWR